MKRYTFRAGAALVAWLSLCLLGQAANAQSANDLSAFVGRWQINLAKTRMERMGPNGKNMVRSATFTFVFAPEKSGLRLDVYAEYPQPAPTRSTVVIADQKQRFCQDKNGCLTVGGNPNEQSWAYYKIDPHMLVRVFYIKGKVSEYTTYAVSPDRKSFTLITWSPETPEYQNIQVFEKQP